MSLRPYANLRSSAQSIDLQTLRIEITIPVILNYLVPYPDFGGLAPHNLSCLSKIKVL